MSRNRKKLGQTEFHYQSIRQVSTYSFRGAPMMRIGKDKWIFTDGEENNRRLSVKGIARMQTFPDWFEFSDGENTNISKNSCLDKN
ncbi:DNA cytosine methyltransferase [Anoxybacteroides rupiense]|uniref:DNA cytosine methyltransferase n=1 Tax=Anoxybacteroides rupiense TaxID=311460 RepID=UPI00366B2E41